VDGTNEEKMERIPQIKQSTTLEDLCESCPKQIYEFMKYVREMPFDADPDYDYMMQLVRDIAETHSFRLDDNVYDWSVMLTLIQENKP
jgi:casein kinase 1